MNLYFIFNFFMFAAVSLFTLYRWKYSTAPVALTVSIAAAAFVSMLLLPDFYTYQWLYEGTPTIKEILFIGRSADEVYGEVGYVLLASIYKLVFDEFYYFRWFLVFTALYLKLWFLLKASVSPLVGIACYFALFFYMDSFILRQSAAAGLIAIALLYLSNEKRLLFVLFVAIGATFHTSALAALPLVFLYKISLTRAKAFIILGVIFAFGFIGLGKFLVLIPDAGGYLDYVSGKFMRYSSKGGDVSTGILRGSVLLYTGGVLLYILFYERIKNSFNNYNFFLIVALYALMFLVSFNDLGIFGDRVFRLFGVAFAVIYSSLPAVLMGFQRASAGYYIAAVFVVLSLFIIPTDRVLLLH